MSGQIFGRDAELQALTAFLGAIEHSATAMVLAGPPGAGKTTLMRAASQLAADRGCTVLATTPARADMRLAFAGLADLIEPYVGRVLDGLPRPQADALRAALLLTAAPASPPEPRLIATAFRSAVAQLAESAPVLVAVDDIQWLDPPSESAVGFAARRFGSERVGLLCAQRTDKPGAQLPLELSRGRLSCNLVPLGGLSIGALHRMLHTRLGRSFPHPTLRRIEAESGGNPLIALEIGRALTRRSDGTYVRALPVPDSLSGLVDEHISELPVAVRAGLELMAILPGVATATYVAAGVDEAELDAAVEAGVLEPAGSHLAFAHPMLRSAVEAMIPPARLRELHLRAARLTENTEDAARHEALAVTEPSAAVAGRLEDSARAAVSRGAPRNAAELFELAASLTPDGEHADKGRRIAEAARYQALRGDLAAAASLLRQFLASAPAGPHRAAALAQLGRLVTDEDGPRAVELLNEALAQAGPDPVLIAEVHMSLSEAMSRSGAPERALDEARCAIVAAERAGGPELISAAIMTACSMQLLDGREVDQDLLQRALSVEDELGLEACMENPASLVAGQASFLAGRLEEAEAHWRRVLAACEVTGQEYWRPDMFMRLSQLAVCRGDLEAAAALAAQGLECAEQLDHPHVLAALLWASGLSAVYRGEVDTATTLARKAMEVAGEASTPTFRLRGESLLGMLELAQGNYRAAADCLGPLAVRWRSGSARFLVTTGLDLEAVDALIGAGDLEQAAALVTDMAATAYGPVGNAIIARCRGHLAAARGDLREGVAQLTTALRLHDQVSPQPLARGRILLLLGGIQLRRKERAAARATLTEAHELFARAGARLWAERALAELARISGRAPAPTDLTATELRVADLVAAGRTNKEAAAELFVSVRAIESTLTKVYAKLGVRSRTELAAVMQHASR